MTGKTKISEYLLLSPKEQEVFQSHRKCEECGNPLVRTSHSAGDLHVYCVTCQRCPDCEDGE